MTQNKIYSKCEDCINGDVRTLTNIVANIKAEKEEWRQPHELKPEDYHTGRCCALFGELRCDTCELDTLGMGEYGYYPASHADVMKDARTHSNILDIRALKKDNPEAYRKYAEACRADEGKRQLLTINK